MPKIIRIINRFNLGGPTYNVAYLSKYLEPRYQTLLIGGMKDDSEASSDFIIKSLGLEPKLIESMRRSINPVNDFDAYRAIVKIIKQEKPDIVHTHAAKSGALGRLAAFSCKVPVVAHTFHGNVFHSYFGKTKTSVFKSIERYLAERSTAIVAISKKQKEELVNVHKIAPEHKVKIVPLGFDLDKFNADKVAKRESFRKLYQLDNEEIAIGIIGRLVPVKNHSLFLEAIQFVAERTKQRIRGFIIVDGEKRQELMDEAANRGLMDPSEPHRHLVTFTSWIKEADWALAGLDILCMTSFNEGTPVSLIEAQASGKPIVSTNVGGIEDITLIGQTTLLAELEDKEGFCNQLLKLVEDAQLRQDFGKAGWDFVKDKFHYSRLVRDMDQLYVSLLNRP